MPPLQDPLFSVPSTPVEDLLLKQTVQLRDDASGCAYQGYEFGAHYPDSVCIEGMLYDADSGEPAGDAGWNYTNGGDIPCPHCNHTAWALSALDDLEGNGYDAASDGKARGTCPHPEKSRFAHLGAAMAARWHAGFDEAMKEDAGAVPA